MDLTCYFNKWIWNGILMVYWSLLGHWNSTFLVFFFFFLVIGFSRVFGGNINGSNLDQWWWIRFLGVFSTLVNSVLFTSMKHGWGPGHFRGLNIASVVWFCFFWQTQSGNQNKNHFMLWLHITRISGWLVKLLNHVKAY